MAGLVHFPKRGVKVHKALTGPIGEAKGVVLTYPAAQFFGITDQQLVDQPISARRAQQLFALAYACMSYRATKVSEPPLWIFEEQDGEEVPIEGDHPLGEFLERPNPDMEMSDLMELVSLYLDATGAVLLVKNRDRGGVPRSMYPYANDEFSVEPADGRLYGKFSVQTLTGYRTFGPDEVIYLKRPSTRHILEACAPMDAALEHVNIGKHLRTAVRAAMRHAVRPGAIFSAPTNLGEDVFERLKAEIDTSYSGVWNSGKSMLTEGGIVTEIQKSTLDELSLGPVNEDVEIAVCQAFQVHPVLVGSRIGLSANSGLSDSIEPAEGLFYDVAAFPLWSRIEKALTRGLLRDIDPDPLRFVRFDKSKVRALQEDLTEKIAQAAAAKEFWSEAEQRQWTGKEGGSDELPSDRAVRVAEEQAAMAEANAGAEDVPPKPIGKSRIVDLVKNGDHWRAIVSSGNGNGHAAG